VTGKRFRESFGNMDDALNADGLSVLNWQQAQQAARAFFA
jgi:hypothetical protein